MVGGDKDGELLYMTPWLPRTIIHDNMASPDLLCLNQQNPTNPKVILSFSISRDSLHTWFNSTFVMHSDNLEGSLDTRLEFSVMGAAMFVYISPGSTLWCIKIISFI